MKRVINDINKLSHNQKITCISIILLLIVFISIGMPTLARLRNRVMIVNELQVWDGTIADSYRDGNGTLNDPYVISNGGELAYFSDQLLTDHYKDKYFILSNDIILNNGIFSYNKTDGVKYNINNNSYFMNEYTNKYYDNIENNGNEIGNINIFNSLKNFEGTLNGNSYRIYGLYVADDTIDELGLFINLKGNVEDLYVENSIVYGGIITSGIASTTNNATIKNTIFDGYVIGKDGKTMEMNVNPTIEPIIFNNIETNTIVDLKRNISILGSDILNTSISGTYTITGSNNSVIKINGNVISNGTFNIDLGTNLLDSITISTLNENSNATITFTNLTYNIRYKYGVSGGIVGISNNTILTNTVNKGYINSYSNAAGLIGLSNNTLTINNSYNTGTIISKNSNGLISLIENTSNDVSINKSYNSGIVEDSGLIGIISNNTGNISITNSFNATDNTVISTIHNSNVDIDNSFYMGTNIINNGVYTGDFTETTLVNLKDKTNLTTNLNYKEFINLNNLKTHEENVWIYNKDSLPILYLDDINNPKANINISNYSWNDYSEELKTLKFKSNIAFNIEKTEELSSVEHIYYYIEKSKNFLTKSELDDINTWNLYTSINQITSEGFYIIYAKLVDYDGSFSYVNTDILGLDLSGSSVTINLNNDTWNDLRNTLDKKYINKSSDITILAVDNLSGIKSIEYYITDEIVNKADLDTIKEWNTYTDKITIDKLGKYVIYAKVIDNSDYVTYVNTDSIIYGGYTETVSIGRNNNYISDDINITDKSTLTYNFTYSENNAINEDITHNLISNILLPVGTKLKLIDNINNKVYKYEITTATDIYNYNNSCDSNDLSCIKTATYPFTLFSEVGNTNNILFEENNYSIDNNINENFTIVLELSNTNILENTNNINIYMATKTNNKISRSTLLNTIKNISVYKTVNNNNTSADLYLNTSYNGSINFNSNSLINIPLSSGLTYKTIDTKNIIDTTYEDKEIGLLIKLVDSNGNNADIKYLRNFIFKIGNKEYSISKDNFVHISLNDGLNTFNNNLTVITNEIDGNFEEGTYYLKIYNYASFDGLYSDTYLNEISIPVNVTEQIINYTYKFDVEMNDSDRIINKTASQKDINFKLLVDGLINPSVKVSLYEKEQLTAFNQNYIIKDLNTYITNNLTMYNTNIYNTINIVQNTKNDFVLSFNTNKLNNISYRLVFDLYEGTNKIGSITKTFIVR